MAKEDEVTRTDTAAAKEAAPVKEPFASKFFTPEGKPIRVLSTSLGIALLANAFLIPGAGATASGNGSSADEPKLVAWSTEEVKQYFDKNVDWNIPLPLEEDGEGAEGASGSGGSGSSSSSDGSGGTTVINHYGGGFGWDDMLLYHLLFNNGSSYSSGRWYDNHRGYYTGSSTPYKPKSYSSETFQNKPMAGSVVRPKTSTSSTGSIVRRSTSSKAGGIGGKSSSLGSSTSSSSSKSSKSSFSGSRSSGTSKGSFGG